jgi:uncharacterized protein YbaP (TraB family)
MEKIKKNSREIALILMIVLIIIGISCLGLKKYFDSSDTNEKDKVQEKVQVTSISTPLIYKVTKDNDDTIMYLFGSIHVADDKAYPIPDLVLNAYEESDYLAVEFDVIAYSKDFDAQIDSLQSLVLNDGTKVNDHLSEETYNLLVKYLKDNNVYNSMYDYYKPAIHYSLVSDIQTELSDLDSDKGIDMYFLEKAYKDKKEILEVESADLQYDILGSLPDKLYDVLINSSIVYEKEMIEGTKELYKAWLEGNVESIIELLETEDEILKDYDDYETIESLMNDYDKALIDDRNITMTSEAVEYFDDNKDVFFVVGLAHIVGENGIANNLKQLGYNVEILNYK